MNPACRCSQAGLPADAVSQAQSHKTCPDISGDTKFRFAGIVIACLLQAGSVHEGNLLFLCFNKLRFES